MPFFIFQIIVFLVFPSLILGQSEKPQTIVVPTGSLGEISEVRKKMLEMTLISNLDDHFAIVPKDLFEEAQEKAFEELDYEECTEEQCIMMIKEIRKRVYLKADQEERLALIKDDMGALRPSLFANVPPFLRFVPPNSLFVPPNSLRGRGVKGRILPEGMEKMGWYDVFSCQTYNHQCIGCFF